MTRRGARRESGALVAFTVVCMFASWLAAATLRVFDVDLGAPHFGTRLFTVSLHYVATMGWQPLLAMWLVRRWIDREPADLALRPSRPAFNVAGAALPLLLAALAMGVAAMAARFGLAAPNSLHGTAEPRLPPIGALGVLLGALVALLFIWLQAVAEEIAWRGYVLPTAMRRFGRFRGLVLHGVAWGLWYAPVMFFSTYGRGTGLDPLLRCLTFSVSCVLVGILLGCLRLASGSVAPVITANLTLTMIAGVPYVMHGLNGGLRSAIFQPVGWLVLGAALAAIFASRWRASIALPEAAATPELPAGALFALLDPRRDRTLH